MNLDEFESLTEGSQESQSLDYKGPMAWDAASLAKDILAFSNVQDGGYIVVGFEDGTFRRVGVDETIADTYALETMQDQMSDYADPYVTFNVYNNIVDSSGKRYVVIKVHEFDEIPIVCRKDSRDTHKGRIYYRSRHRRMESSTVTNSYDMRDILDRAAFKLMARRDNQGFVPRNNNIRGIYDEELGGL